MCVLYKYYCKIFRILEPLKLCLFKETNPEVFVSLFFFFFGCFLSIFLRAYYIINRLCFLFVFFSLICHDIPTDIKDMCVILTYCFKIRYGLSLYMSAMHLMHILTSQPFCLNAHYTEDLEQLQHKLLCS